MFDTLKKRFKDWYLKPSDLIKTVSTSSYFLFIFIINTVYTSIYNLPIYFIYRSEGFFAQCYLLRSYLLTFLLNLVIFLAISIYRTIFYITLPLLFTLSSITTFLIINFKVKLNMNAIALVFETNIHEALGVTGEEMILFVTFSILLSLILLLIFHRRITHIPKKAAIYLIVLQSLFINFPVMTYFSYKFRGIPNDIYIFGKMYLKEKRESIKMSRKRIDLASKYRFELTERDITTVLIIGEAARGLNFSSNGYNRETDPNLRAVGAISYRNAYSCGTITRQSVPCMLTRATFRRQDISRKERSVISIFNSLGFTTYWISNQGVMGEHETPITPIINESQHKIFVNITGAFEDKDVLDENIVPKFDSIIRSYSGNKFIVVHLIGSHWYYGHHYTKPFERFTPVCKSKIAQRCSREELLNSYDNSILYTDWVVSELIKRVSNQNSILFFVSDHGESLGEEGVYTHRVEDIDRTEQRSIAWFVWASDEYKRRNTIRFDNIIKNKDNYISHDNLFHSILDCAAIESEVIDKGMSICHKME